MIDANTPAGAEVWELCPYNKLVTGPYRFLHMGGDEAAISEPKDDDDPGDMVYARYRRSLGDLFLTQRDALLALVTYRQQRLDEALAELAAHDAEQAEATP